jgi:hypothetical protein
MMFLSLLMIPEIDMESCSESIAKIFDGLTPRFQKLAASCEHSLSYPIIENDYQTERG